MVLRAVASLHAIVQSPLHRGPFESSGEAMIRSAMHCSNTALALADLGPPLRDCAALPDGEALKCGTTDRRSRALQSGLCVFFACG